MKQKRPSAIKEEAQAEARRAIEARLAQRLKDIGSKQVRPT